MADTLAHTAVGMLTSRRRPLALASLCTVLFLTFLDNTVVSVALASIQSDLHGGVSALQWVVGAYALTFASFMLAFGMLGDKFGRKKIMLAGAGVYCVGAALAAVAPSIGILIAARSVMGLGAAASEPGTLSMIRHLYPDERSRNRALGVWAAVSGFSLALGPVLGGALVGAWSWRGIFWFDVTFGLAALVVAAMVLPESADPHAGRVDMPGTVLGAGALAALIFGIINGESAGYTAPSVLALFAVSLVAGAAFLLWERRAPFPLLDLSYLRVPRFTTPNVVAYCTYFATFAIFFFTALYLSVIAGYSAYRIAGLFLPMTVMMILAALLAGRWTTVARRPLAAGRRLPVVRSRPAADQRGDQPEPRLPAARRGARIGRRRHRHLRRAGHLVSARCGTRRAVGDGRVGHEHQPGVRRGHWHRHPGCRRQCRVAVWAGQPHDASGCLGRASAICASGDRDGFGVPRPWRLNRKLATGPDHPGGVRGLHQRAARCAVSVGRAARKRRAALRGHLAPAPPRYLSSSRWRERRRTSPTRR